MQDEGDNNNNLEFGIEEHKFDDWYIEAPGAEELYSKSDDENMAADVKFVSMEFDFYEYCVVSC